MRFLVVAAIMLGAFTAAQAAENFEFNRVGASLPSADPQGGREHPPISDKAVFGAVGIDEKKDFLTFGGSPKTSKADAITAVEDDCSHAGADCTKFWFQWGCGVFVTAPDGRGMSVEATFAQARDAALKDCRSQGTTGCHVEKVLCAPRELE